MITPVSHASFGLKFDGIPNEFRPNPTGDRPADHPGVHGFMDYTDDDGFARVADGTSNTIFGP